MSFALLQFNPSSVVVLDTEGRIRSLNANAVRLLGASEADAVGRPYTDVFGPSLSSRVFSLVMKGARSEVKTIEATLPGGRRAKLRASAGPLRDRDGGVNGIVFVADEETSSPKIELLEEQQERLEGALRRYLGDNVAEMVAARPSFIDVGGRTQTVSVLHADVRGYTTMAEETPPDRVVSLLLRYHGAAAKAIRANAGTIDRFAGDAILALWNAPAEQPDHVLRALRGALAMRDAAQAVGEELGYGVGVHTGEAMVGNLGSDEYQNFTAIGDTVNVAARLQSQAKAGEVICSSSVLRLLGLAGVDVKAEPLGALELKGRKTPVEAFRVEGIT